MGHKGSKDKRKIKKPSLDRSFLEQKSKTMQCLFSRFHLLDGEFHEVLIDACAERIVKKNLKLESNVWKYNFR